MATGEYMVITDPVVNVNVTSTATHLTTVNRLQRNMTIDALKMKLELVTGIAFSDMVIEAYNSEDVMVCRLDDDVRFLGSYPVVSGMRLHVVDRTGKSLECEDLSKVEKYEISEDSYAQRTDSVRAFKERMKMGQFKEVDSEEKQRKEKLGLDEKMKAESIPVGSRCEVRVPDAMTKRGTVMFVGQPGFKPGYWVGVKYDEPLGKNDGSVAGKRYFECPPKYGAFVRPNQITVGDFPEVDIEDEDLEM